MMKFTINGTVKSVKIHNAANVRNMIFASGFLLMFFVTGLLCIVPEFRESYAPVLFAIMVPFCVAVLIVDFLK